MITVGPAARYPGLRILRNLHAALEADMLECFRFVEPSLDNEDVYSVRLLEIHGRACAAVDSVLNLWYQELGIGEKKSPNVRDYFTLLERIGIVDTELSLQHRPDFVVRPLDGWKEETRIPPWWTAHNRTKHALNDDTFRLATLRNALSALGGLYLVLSDRETRGTHPITTRVFRPMW